VKQIQWLVFLPALLACQEEVVVSVYQAVPVATRDISVSAQAAGVIEPDTTVEVKSKASGEILEIMVQTGDRVERGALMVRVDQRIPRNSLLQSEASLEVARARLANALAQKRRSDELYQTQSITQTEYEDTLLDYANAKAGLVQAEVAVENDRIAMDDTDVRAPISGTIIAKNVERGQVISSPTRDVAGGTVLLTMADLTLVQVRTLVDETDIGKIRPGLDATVSVASYPNQPFEGQVLKIEPMAETQQNVTMFPVLIRIPNTDGLLRPGMNAEVEISIGRREGVLAVPNAALRTDRDVGSAAEVLGLTLEAVQAQLARPPEVPGRQASSPPAAEASDRETLTLRNGRTVELPPGVTAEQARAIMNKRRSGEPLTEDEQEIGRQMFQAFQGGRGGEPGRGAEPKQQAGNIQIADYVVFVLRDGVPTAVRIKTGLTDLDYSEVLAGLTAADSVVVLRNIAQQAS
jgi:HlyD family secretion protein